MTRKEFITQFCIHNGCAYIPGMIMSEDDVIRRASRMAQCLEMTDPDFFDEYEWDGRMQYALGQVLDVAQKDGGFAIQLNKTQHEDIVQAVSL